MSRVSEVLSSAAVFDDRIHTREAAVGIVGLGYAGLPLAMVFAEAGFNVTGVDISDQRVRAVQERRSYLVDVPAERYEAAVAALRERGAEVLEHEFPGYGGSRAAYLDDPDGNVVELWTYDVGRQLA